MTSELSRLERMCLHWAAQGKSLTQVAIIVGTTKDAVHSNLQRARRKMGASNTTHLVAIATTLGMVSVDIPIVEEAA